jgi:hypothetical protein
MKRILLMTSVALLAVMLMATAALAVSNAHFAGKLTAERVNDTLVVSGKVAGLGNVSQIDVTVSADAEYINPGSKKPKAANKESFSDSFVVPVQNGKANFSLVLAPDFSPQVSSMTIVFSNVTVIVTADDGTYLTHTFPGTF